MHLKYAEMLAIVVHENMKLAETIPVNSERLSHEIADKKLASL